MQITTIVGHVDASQCLWASVHMYTVEPPRKGHFGEMALVPCREVVPISEVYFVFIRNGDTYIIMGL